MRLSISTYNGNAINDGTNFTAGFPGGDQNFFNLPGVSVNEIPRPDNAPVLASKVLQGKYFTIAIECRGTFATQWDTLKRYFQVNDQELHPLVVTDLDTSTSYFIECTCVGNPVINTSQVEFLMYAPEAVLQALVESHETWTITASGQKKELTVGGNIPAKPRMVITPTSAGGTGFAYRRFVALYNVTTKTFTDYPWDLAEATPGTKWDTTGLVTAGKMQADGDDLRVYIDGAEVERWLSDINDTDTGVWVNLNLHPKCELTLSGAIASSGAITEIPFKVTKANKTALGALKSSGMLMIGSEIFTYTAKDVKKLKVTGVTRAMKNTSMAAHADGDTVRWIEHEIWIFYGNSSLAAPEQTDDKKPIFDLSASTNISWVYATFADLAGLRTGSWKGSVVKSANTRDLAHKSKTYTGSHGVDADPATELGCALMAWLYGSAWKSETGTIEWRIYSPAGFTTVSLSGYKYRSSANWPALATVQRSNDGYTWGNAWATEASPSAAATWEALSDHSAVSLGATYNHLRVVFSGSLGASANNAAYFEGTDVTLVPDSNFIPVQSMSSEISNYHLQAKITNNDTGEYIQLAYGMDLNTDLTVNCDEKTVTFEDGSKPLAALTLSSVRGEWLDLDPGTPELQFDDAGTAGVTIEVYWRNRYG